MPSLDSSSSSSPAPALWLLIVMRCLSIAFANKASSASLPGVELAFAPLLPVMFGPVGCVAWPHLFEYMRLYERRDQKRRKRFLKDRATRPMGTSRPARPIERRGGWWLECFFLAAVVIAEGARDEALQGRSTARQARSHPPMARQNPASRQRRAPSAATLGRRGINLPCDSTTSRFLRLRGQSTKMSRSRM